MEEYSNSIPSLPTDILIEVFCRLPVKTLVQLCCVCKFLKNLIRSDHIFIRCHLKQSLEKTTRSRSNVLMYSKSRRLTHELPDHVAPKFINAGESSLRRAFFLGYGFFLVGCINGVFCFYELWDYDVYLWNPALHQYWILPRSRYKHFSVVGFVFEPTNIDYKVVKIWTMLDGKVKVDIYSLRSNCWKSSICHRHPSSNLSVWNQTVAVVHNGALHWLSWDLNDETLFLNVYDLSGENLEETVLSDRTSIKPFCARLGLFRGCICLTGRSTELDSEVWVMKAYGDRSSWIKQFTFPSYIFRPWSYESVITSGKFVAAWGRWQENIMTRQENIILYDPESKGIELVQNEEVLYEWDKNYFFVDKSLVSVFPQNRTTHEESSISIIPQDEASPKQSSVSILSPEEITPESLVSIIPVDETTPEETLVSITPTDKTSEESLVSVVPLNRTTHEECSISIIAQDEAISPKESSVSIVSPDERTQDSLVPIIPVDETTPEETLDLIIPTDKTNTEECLVPSNFCVLRRMLCCLFV